MSEKKRWWSRARELFAVIRIIYLPQTTLLQWAALSSSRKPPWQYIEYEPLESPEQWRVFGWRRAMSSSISRADEWTTNLSKESTLKREKIQIFTINLVWHALIWGSEIFLDECDISNEALADSRGANRNKSLSRRFTFNLWWHWVDDNCEKGEIHGRFFNIFVNNSDLITFKEL